MNIDALNNFLSEYNMDQLPGEDAQRIMSPRNRLSMLQAKREVPNPKPSAVMLLLYPKNKEVFFVLIRRKEYDGVHSKQISFPGGGAEPADDSLENTALRELQEEVGVDANKVKIIIKLSDLIIQPSSFLVHPFIGIIHAQPVFIPDTEEVDDILEIPLRMLLDEQCVTQTKVFIKTVNRQMKVPCFNFRGHIVWGATAMILSEAKEIFRQKTQ